MNDLENVSGNDFENALRAMDKISRYERRALSQAGIAQIKRLKCRRHCAVPRCLNLAERTQA
jgi:hypothetical protein